MLHKQKNFILNILNQIKMKILYTLIIYTLIISTLAAQTEYKAGPNSAKYDNIPHGTVTKFTFESKVITNTTRDYYIYLPAQYDKSKPAALMVFQDGHAYIKEDGEYKVGLVFDNLIAQEKMPVTIALFVNPGHEKDKPAIENPFRSSNRSVEYDEVSATYGKMIVEEFLPMLNAQYNISDDPKMRAISGLSSGAICAFSVAWFHNDQFQKVLSHIGSFTDIRGGHAYPSMIRKNDKKNIKVFLQDGSNDLDNQFGNWYLANQQMAKALKFKGYEYKFVEGDGGHNGKHGGSILPESLEWLWSDVVAKNVASTAYKADFSKKVDTMMNGTTVLFSKAQIIRKTIAAKEEVKITKSTDERMFILGKGTIEAKLNKERKTLNAGSVIFLAAGDELQYKVNAEAMIYDFSYIAKQRNTAQFGKTLATSFIKSFDEITFTPHDRGGVRSYFNTATPMCAYYEMHMTNLNPGIKSHEPHTHRAAEIVLMLEGNTEMEVGNNVIRASEGDFYYLDSSIPHAIKNIGDKQSRYLAYQWN
jgi:enterochelin esterase-like enzyme/quercetin dioxygenase-like cupin family protein